MIDSSSTEILRTLVIRYDEMKLTFRTNLHDIRNAKKERDVAKIEGCSVAVRSLNVRLAELAASTCISENT
jgi:hypothetical protein